MNMVDKSRTLYKAKENTNNEMDVVLHTPDIWQAGCDLLIKITTDTSINSKIKLHYRKQNQLEGAFLTIDMIPESDYYKAIIPGDYITKDFNLLVFVSIQITKETTKILPGLWSKTDAMSYREITIIE